MINWFLIILGKSVSIFAKCLNLGNGSTWPGHIALTVNKNFIKEILIRSNLKIIVIAGTNGKTTTAKLLSTILSQNGKSVIRNSSGANLLNGIASALLLNTDTALKIKADYAIFETDENALPLVLKEITPDYLLILNLFRDQLDRYGEINIIIEKWKKAIKKITPTTTLILNADDPQVAALGLSGKLNSIYFSIRDSTDKAKIRPEEDAIDSAHCPSCGNSLNYKSISFSHLGEWYCSNCKLNRPQKAFSSSPFYPLYGKYNEYNTNAAVLFAEKEKFSKNSIARALKTFEPAFGRQEVIKTGLTKAVIILSKNPTGFNESLKTVKFLGAKNILLVLNDRIPDGTDISWIWDTDIENILDFDENIIISGDRAFEMGLRIKYANPHTMNLRHELNYRIIPVLNEALKNGLADSTNTNPLYVIPTYTAMLEVRKLLTGKKIL